MLLYLNVNTNNANSHMCDVHVNGMGKNERRKSNNDWNSVAGASSNSMKLILDGIVELLLNSVQNGSKWENLLYCNGVNGTTAIDTFNLSESKQSPAQCTYKEIICAWCNRQRRAKTKQNMRSTRSQWNLFMWKDIINLARLLAFLNGTRKGACVRHTCVLIEFSSSFFLRIRCTFWL